MTPPSTCIRPGGYWVQLTAGCREPRTHVVEVVFRDFFRLIEEGAGDLLAVNFAEGRRAFGWPEPREVDARIDALSGGVFRVDQVTLLVRQPLVDAVREQLQERGTQLAEGVVVGPPGEEPRDPRILPTPVA